MSITDYMTTIRRLKKGKAVEFTTGVTVEHNAVRPGYHVTDKHGKTYSSLSIDHATMIAMKGE